MSCSPFDLKDYFLKELPPPQRVQVEAHVRQLPSTAAKSWIACN